ncbi:MAG: O-antigen ligase family protein, partial [Sedimentisphaerales bacterium]|nr:O-antigen ligase family protein [Sedimentisphaerales bacterium]
MIYSKTSWWLQPVVAYVPRLSLVMLVFIVLGCVMHAGSLDWKIAKIEKELYVFLGIVWIVSLFFGLDLHSGSWMYLDKLTKSFFFIFLLLRVVHSIERYNLVLWTFVLGGSFLALQAIFVGGYTDSRLDTIGGVDFNEANAFSAFLSIGVVVLAFKMLNAPVVKKIFYVLTVALMLNVIILAQSRAVFMGLVLAFAYVLIFSPKIYRKRIIIYMLLGIMMFFVLVDKSFLERMSTIKTHLDQGQLAQLNDSESEELSRFDFWRASIKIFKDHPLGIGVKNFEKTVSIYDPRNPGLDAHNTYVLCYAEIGILGILMFLFLIYEIFMQMR